MYFNDKNNTNIDSEFNNKKNILQILNRYKLFILITIITITLIILIIFFTTNKKRTNYLILNGEENITLYQGADYIEPGYSAYNSKNENLNSNINISSNLDINNIGEYEITYTIGDITKTRTITVIEKPKEYTYIYLKTVNNDINVYLKVNEEYVEPGYQVFSSTGINLTDQVKVTGDVDISKKGTYKLIYSVIDSNNVTITATRTVIVMDSEISLSLSNDEYTNKDINIEIKVIDNYFDYMILPNGEKTTKTTLSYKVSTNGTYTFAVYNKRGNKKESSINVSNIDRTPPTGSCSGSYKAGKSTININANDNIGISKYIIEGTEYITTDTKITKSIPKKLEKANITIYDKAGNSNNFSCSLKSENTTENTKKNKTLEIHFIASGAYDDAILIRDENKTIFIDGGRWSCRKKVTPYLKTIGVTKIDIMIGSHLHYDHIQMQADILDNFTVNKIYYPDDIFNCVTNKSCTKEDQNYIVSGLNKHNKTPAIIKPGNKIKIDDLELYFLGPPKIINESAPQNTNSFVFILKFYNNTFMFTGDAAHSTLNVDKLKEHANILGIDLNIDLLKYPHHGNATLKDTFLEITDPEYTVIPNYLAPKYPHSSNINKLKKYNVEMYRQSDSSTGNILVTSDGKNIEIYNNITAENYKNKINQPPL